MPITSVRSLDDITLATQRLAGLIAQAQHLSPPAVAALAQSHGNSLLTLAAILDDLSSSEREWANLSEILKPHVSAMRVIARFTRPLRSLQRPDQAPGTQMRQIRRHWQ